MEKFDKRKIIVVFCCILTVIIGIFLLVTKTNNDKNEIDKNDNKLPIDLSQITIIPVSPPADLKVTFDITPVPTNRPDYVEIVGVVTEIPTPLPTVIVKIPTPTPMPNWDEVITIPSFEEQFPEPDENGMLGRAQMGENVFYEIYADGTLKVVGTGSTWDFEDYDDIATLIGDGMGFQGHVMERGLTDLHGEIRVWLQNGGITRIEIEEGITRIGKYALGIYFLNVEEVVIPSSLHYLGEVAFRALGRDADNTEWIGLNLDNLTYETTTFAYANIELDNLVVAVPTLSPTPTPAPEYKEGTTPVLVFRTKLGDNCEFWAYNDGRVFLKGSGATKDEMWYYDFTLDYWYDYDIKEIYVEEGITYIGSNIFNVVGDTFTVYLPKSIQYASYSGVFLPHGCTIAWFDEGNDYRTFYEINVDTFFSEYKTLFPFEVR